MSPSFHNVQISAFSPQWILKDKERKATLLKVKKVTTLKLMLWKTTSALDTAFSELPTCVGAKGAVNCSNPGSWLLCQERRESFLKIIALSVFTVNTPCFE